MLVRSRSSDMLRFGCAAHVSLLGTTISMSLEWVGDLSWSARRYVVWIPRLIFGFLVLFVVRICVGMIHQWSDMV